MNIKLVIFFFVCFEAVHFQKSQLIRIPKTNFYHKIHNNVDSILNKLFTPLKINMNLSKSVNFKMLRTLHLYFNKMAKKYFRVYEELRYISDINVSKSNKRYLEKIIQRFVQEEIDDVKSNNANITARPDSNKTEYIENAFNSSKQNQTSTPGVDCNKAEHTENVFENRTTNITSRLRPDSNKTEYIENAFNVSINNQMSAPGADYNKAEHTENVSENRTTNITFRLTPDSNKTEHIENAFNSSLDNKTSAPGADYNKTAYTENVFENRTTNITFRLGPDSNKTEYTKNALENYNELWSNIGDKTIENIINPIILNKTMVPNNFSFYTENILNELKAWGLSSEESEPQHNNTRRIYKGKKTKIKNYPFLVSIHMMDDFLCSGSIISKDMVISAASCLQTAYNNKLQGDRTRSIFIRVGSDYAKHSGDLIPVGELFFHPQYNSVNLRHNLVIIKTVDKLKLSTKKKIKRIKYDRKANALPSDVADVLILGWGYKDAKHKPTNQKLALARLDIYNIKDCEEVYSKYYVSEKNFCAGFTSKGGGACMGDVGGPAVVSKELVGVISFGPAVCGLADAPTVLTKVGYYAEWINSIVNEKPEMRNAEFNTVTTGRSTQTGLVVIPLYTTGSPLPPLFQPTERSKMREDPEEIHVLKEIIQEFILTNRTVIDYLINGPVLDDEEQTENPSISYENEKLFLDLDKYKPVETKTKLHKQIKNVTIVPRDRLKITHKVTHTAIKPKKKQPLNVYLRTTNSPRDDDDTETAKGTTIITFFESSEFPDEDFSNYDKDIPHQSGETSSYYEIEIPIEYSHSALHNVTVMGYLSQKKTTTTKRQRFITGIIYMSDELVKKSSTIDQSDETTDETTSSDESDKTERREESSTADNLYNVARHGTTAVANLTNATKRDQQLNKTDQTKNIDQLPLPAGIGISISDDDISYGFAGKTVKPNGGHKNYPNQYKPGTTVPNRGVWWKLY